MRAQVFILLTVVLCASIPAATGHGGDPPPGPEWVHHHWVWGDASTQDSAEGFVAGFLDHDMPVQAGNLGSRPLETR